MTRASRFLALCLLVGCAAPSERVHVPETDVLQVEANGLTFAVLEEGEGPLVLLLHGFPDTAHTWDTLRPAIAAQGFRAVSPFMRGYAPTDVPNQDVDYETLALDVIGLIDALGEDRATVIGHDWGAGAAYAAAALAPERIEQLVVVAIPPPGTLRATPASAWSGRHFFQLRRPGAVRLMQRDDFAYVDELYARWSPTWDVPDPHLERVKNTFAADGSLDAALGYYRGIGLDDSFFDDRSIPVATTLIGGTDDLLRETAFTEDAAAGIDGPLTTHMLPGGHFVHLESPDAFEDIVLDVLQAP